VPVPRNTNRLPSISSEPLAKPAACGEKRTSNRTLCPLSSRAGTGRPPGAEEVRRVSPKKRAD
jgi:hypothetical protein